MTGTNDPLQAPFRIIADPCEATDGWQFKGLYDAAQPTRRLIVPIVYQRLEIADYTVEDLPLFIVRRHAQDFAAALRNSPDLVRDEHQRLRALEAAGGSCLVVIEGQHDEIEQVLEVDSTVQAGKNSHVPWLFVPNRSAAELIVYSIIQRAWRRAHEEDADVQ